jgi:hypothetical protein
MTKISPPWVTIVSGLPRSGTSMMMQMLVAGGMHALVDNVRTADEDNVRGYLEYEPVKHTRRDPSWIAGAVGKVVKMVYLLLYDLPAGYSYRVVFMQRPMDEMLLSQQKMLQRRGQLGASLPPHEMAEAFVRERGKVEDWLAGQPNFRSLRINYHDVLANASEQAERISEFLAIDLDRRAMAAAVEPELRHQKT